MNEWDTQACSKFCWKAEEVPLAITSDEKGDLFVGYETTGEIVKYKTKTWKRVKRTIKVDGGAQQVLIHNEGGYKYLVVSGSIGGIHKWNHPYLPKKGDPLREKDFIPLGNRMASSVRSSKGRIFWINDEKFLYHEADELELDDSPSAFEMDKKGRYAMLIFGKTIRVLDTKIKEVSISVIFH